MTQYDSDLKRLRQVIIDTQFRSKGLGSLLGKQITFVIEWNL